MPGSSLFILDDAPIPIEAACQAIAFQSHSSFSPLSPMSTYQMATCSSAHADQEDEIRGIWKRKITLKSWGVVEPPGRVGEERESHFERAIGEFREGAGKPEKKIMDLIIEVEARSPGLPPSRMLDKCLLRRGALSRKSHSSLPFCHLRSPPPLQHQHHHH